ncbi:hypothetical protein CK203_041031 [Vitis vinifera]|uniref:Uncharacterized protein n=1 Tax=Vitis vinifera TaxID=29760 RepID=A0A438H9Z1_VITVI|nr:hypothetical protein CK203_041031 [Vitis vinifera]
MAGSDCSSTNELEDSSDTALQLLFDFPVNNDMSFLEGNLDTYPHSLLCCLKAPSSPSEPYA